LRRRRIVLAYPPSFVMLRACVSSLMTGSGTSTPTSDHVPEEM
jgi:hypothetical protein